MIQIGKCSGLVIKCHMNKKNFLVIALIIAAAAVRLWKMEYFPLQSDGDELAYVFAGQSLVELGVPVSWSSFITPGRIILDPYLIGDPNFHAEDTFTFVQPWFDHPPLLPWIEGFWVRLWGYNFPSIPPSIIIRIPIWLFSIVTLILVYKITEHLFDTKAGILALVLYGFSPGIVFGTRMVMGENLYIPIMLLSLFLLMKQRSLILPIILNTLAGLSKITGLFSIPLTMVWLIVNRKYKDAAFVGISSMAIFMGLMLAYGKSIDLTSFLATINSQGFRLVGWSNPAYILSIPGFYKIPILDMSYYLIMVLGFGYFLTANLQNKHSRFLLVSTIGAWLLIWLSSGEQQSCGWYKLPLFTFLAMAGGQLISLSKQTGFVSLLFIITLISNLGLVRYPTHPLPEANVLRLVIVVLMGLPLLVELLSIKLKHYHKWLIRTVLAAYIVQSLYISTYYYDALCRDRTCPVPLKTLKTMFYEAYVSQKK